MIINIRGTNGSGKTHLIKRLMTEHSIKGCFPVVAKLGERPEALCLDEKLYIIGNYEEYAAHGGADGIKTSEEICNRIRKYSKLGNVIFEGIIVSTVFQRWFDLSKELNQPWLWLFLNTPLETCYDNISHKNMNITYNKGLVHGKFRGIERTAIKAEEAGEWVLRLNNEDAFNRIEEFMRNWSIVKR